MGIDVYMHWKGQTDEEAKGQITGFSTLAGRAGYLREAYHGGPYVTRYLCAESFNDGVGAPDEDGEYKGEPIPAAVLRERLPVTVMLAIYRNAVVYGEGDPAIIQLPEGSEPKEGEVPKEILPKLADIFGTMIPNMRKGTDEFNLAARTTPEQIEQAKALIERRALPDFCLSFVDFVRLAEAKERDTGEPVRIYASY